ncbi:MAG TPA: molybdopterin cofactor-binding domain-containing protein [Candidatus Acidoferrales bacterium]|nr:molybdopterin cofactor-binding domain-containing protein [Candidatus Acidoferrales bacterium]
MSEEREHAGAASTGVTRRRFLFTAALTAGGLVLKCATPLESVVASGAADASKVVALNAWLKIGTDDTVTIVVSQAEMGQGITTTLPAILADELGADWSRVRFENSPTDPAYRNPRLNWQFTGNSESMTAFFDLMRQMGASAREMLIGAAAQKWNVDPSSCRSEAGRIVHAKSRRSARFGDLVEAAAKITPPTKPALKSDKDWTLIGKSVPRVENPAKIDGSAVFGLDFTLPGLVNAAVRQCPVFGGDVASFDRSSIAGFPGIIDVVRIPNGVAVVAKTYWQAKSALDALRVTFNEGPAAAVSTSALRDDYRRAMDGNEWLLVHVEGNADALHHDYPSVPLSKDVVPAITGESARRETYPTIYAQEYESQFLAHATMEPMNCTARVSANTVEIWGPTQGQELTRLTLAAVFNLPKENIQVSRTLLGGGFGRRLVADFALQAALVSKAVGRPVKVVWSREEDMQHDIYRPGTLHRITAGINEYGKLRAMAHRLVSPSILQYVYAPAVTNVYDPSCLEGLLETHYDIPNIRVDFKLLHVPVPTSVLRTTGYGPNIFALESFIDELASKKGTDPYRYRRDLLAKSPRSLAVLDLAARKSNWETPAPKGHYRGIAYAEAFQTRIAHVVELSVSKDREVKIHRIICVADLGTPLDPDITTNSLEGGIAWGLSCAFKSEITFDSGRTVQSNFHDYSILRIPEMPPVEVHLINSGARPLGGVGEVGPVTLLPAVANAIFAATDTRFRSLPLSRHGFSLA